MSPELRRSRIWYLGGCWILAAFHLIKAVWLERGGLVGKELAAQPKGLNSDPWHPCKKQGPWHVPGVPVLGRQTQEDPGTVYTCLGSSVGKAVTGGSVRLSGQPV